MTRDFLDFISYLLSRYFNLPQDVKPRGGHAYSTRKGKGKHPKGKGHGKGKGKDKSKGRSLADNEYFEQSSKHPRLHERQAQAVEIAETPDDSEDTMDSNNRSHISNRSRQSSSNRTVLRVHDIPETSDTNPNLAVYYYCAYHGFNLSHQSCATMPRNIQQRQATLPSDCTPRGRTPASFYVPEILRTVQRMTACPTSEGAHPDQPVFRDHYSARHGQPASSTTSEGATNTIPRTQHDSLHLLPHSDSARRHRCTYSSLRLTHTHALYYLHRERFPTRIRRR